MNLEEAKQSIGKIVKIYVANVPETLHLGAQNYKLKYVNDSGLCGLALESNDMARCEIHRSDIYLGEEMMKYKIGDEVVLRTETKPYTFLNCNENRVKIFGNLSDKQNYSVLSISLDGDLSIGTDGNHICHINPRHVKLKEQSMNYKIRVTPETSAEVQELFFALGCSWTSGKDIKNFYDIDFLITDGTLLYYRSDKDPIPKVGIQEITLPQLRDMVVLKRNDVSDATHTYKCDKLRKYYIGHSVYRWNDSCWQEIPLNETYISGWLKLISADTQMAWQDALRAVTDGKEVEVKNISWFDINDLKLGQIKKGRSFRLAPQRKTLNGKFTKEELLKIAGEME